MSGYSTPSAATRLVRFVALFCLAVLGACTSVERLALPAPELGDRYWAASETRSRTRVDHGAWDAFLATYVATDSAGVNRVDYAAVTAADRAALGDYLDRLQATEVSRLSRDEQLAFWINLYNARTVALILDNYPVGSIRDITYGLLSFGPWDEPLLNVEGRALSLNDVEHGIVRPIWADRRVHYVLNCAAVGCPNLGLRAYTGATIDAAMETAARIYVNDPRGARFDAEGRLIVSKIYGWFREDFGDDHQGVLAELRRYAAPALRERLDGRESVDGYEYDWALNDARGL